MSLSITTHGEDVRSVSDAEEHDVGGEEQRAQPERGRRLDVGRCSKVIRYSLIVGTGIQIAQLCVSVCVNRRPFRPSADRIRRALRPRHRHRVTEYLKSQPAKKARDCTLLLIFCSTILKCLTPGTPDSLTDIVSGSPPRVYNFFWPPFSPLFLHWRLRARYDCTYSEPEAI